MDSGHSDVATSDDGTASASSTSAARALLLKERSRLTHELVANPYDLLKHLERAVVYSDLGYPDLAAGDAYRALLLCDEVGDEGFEYHELVVEALDPYTKEEPLLVLKRIHAPPATLSDDLRNLKLGERGSSTSVQQLAKQASFRCFEVLSMSLLLCGCLKSAYEFCKRGLAMSPDDTGLLQTRDYILNLAKRRMKTEQVDFQDLPDQGLVRREIYPWNIHEPDRFSPETLDRLNTELKAIAPKCEVRATQLPTLVESMLDRKDDLATQTNTQLGIFVTEDIAPGETVLNEYTVLTATNRLRDSFCDACSDKLPALGDDSQVVSCPECSDTMFCNDFCLSQAQARYHPAMCNKDEVDTLARDPAAKESSDSLYLLLLARTFAMAETQDVHPLELKEVRYIWGDFVPTQANDIPISLTIDAEPPPVWTLPFTFAGNITGPLHVLERMDVDVFATLSRFDFWIFNTLYSKFRGTASARVNEQTGRPEVAAVHSLWCLANHDCDPNVQWDWAGRMKLWCREKRVCGAAPGIRKDGEVLNHYCDVELHVKERRQWAKGSLGGDCVCGRCRREAAGEQEGLVEGLLDGYPRSEDLRQSPGGDDGHAEPRHASKTDQSS